MASYSVPVQWTTTVLGRSHSQKSTRGALVRPLESTSSESLRVMALDLYSMRKYHLRRRGGCALGSILRRARQLESAATKACTQASDVCACNLSLENRRMRSLALSQMPLWRTVRQKKTRVRL